MAKKTEVRVKRTDAWAETLCKAIKYAGDGDYAPILSISAHTNMRYAAPVTIIDRRDLSDLEARLKAAEAECKELRRQLKAAGVIIKTLRENRV